MPDPNYPTGALEVAAQAIYEGPDQYGRPSSVTWNEMLTYGGEFPGNRDHPLADNLRAAAGGVFDALAAMSPEDRAALALWLTRGVDFEADEAFEARIEAATVKRITEWLRGRAQFDGDRAIGPASAAADAIDRKFGGGPADLYAARTEVANLRAALGDPQRVRPAVAAMPRVTTLCGSARFAGEMLTAHRRLCQNGHIVIPLDPVPTSGELYLRKIDLSDGIYVVNVSGYVGTSTKAEIAYARKQGKTVEFMFPPESIDWGSVAADGL